MRLSKIEIENYKSIKNTITVNFYDDKPTVLIGKNGSGKTNILEALSVIARVNAEQDPYYGHNKARPSYRAHIQLSEADVKNMLPDAVYDREKCEVVAYNSGEDFRINRIKSDYVVPLIKKEIDNIKKLANELKDAVDLYNKQLFKISHSEDEELPLNFYQLKNKHGITSYREICASTELFLKNACEVCERIQKLFVDEENALNAIEKIHLGIYLGVYNYPLKFQLEYIKPDFPEFEKKFITINEEAIKEEIAKINKATAESCEKIESLQKEIKEKIDRVRKNLEVRQDTEGNDLRYGALLKQARKILGTKCLFFKNENKEVIFKRNEQDTYQFMSNPIVETYMRHVYNGSDKENVIKNGKSDFSEQDAKDFEEFLNKNLPPFEKEMYENISVELHEKRGFLIYLNEKTGDRVALNETSAGRRWYFTYYFMKNILSAGDIFIIDEPAAMLHPSAQREVLGDLMELTKQGVKVVYSTHSPYLIPDEWQCVHFVTMTEEGTEVNCVSSNQELVSQMTDIVGEDIFDIQIVLEKYILASPEIVARNISALIRETQKKRGIKNLQIVCDEIGIEHQAMKSWNYWPTAINGERNKKFNSPSIQNIAKVLRWAKKYKITCKS